MTHTPTAEQQAILDGHKNSTVSIMIQADAGCAKTSTLEMLAKQQARAPIPALAIAFNKKTANELQARMPPSFKCKTLSGLGYSAWAKKLGMRQLNVQEYKINDLIKELGPDWIDDFAKDEDAFMLVKDLINGARQAGLMHSEWEEQHPGLISDCKESWDGLSDEAQPREDVRLLAREVLRRDIEMALEGTVDFDDMVYCSVLLGGRYEQYPLVLVDEMQDLNELNIIQVSRVARGRIIAVGDPKQGIYQFRGADPEAIEKLRALRPKWLDFPLHVTFRCPKVMVAKQQGHAPGFTAHEANPEGEFIRWIKNDEAEGAIMYNGLRSSGWTYKWMKGLCGPGEKPFVMCRNNAPLMALAFKLIKEGKVPLMLGRDIGKSLVSLSRKIEPKDSAPLDQFIEKVNKWKKDETAKAQQAKRGWLVSGINDRADSLLAVADSISAKDTGALRKAIVELFRKSDGDVELSTGHRAKGLERPVTIHLDPWRIPSRYALEAAEAGDHRQLEQERNLKYVLETRTRRVHVEANVEDYMVE